MCTGCGINPIVMIASFFVIIGSLNYIGFWSQGTNWIGQLSSKLTGSMTTARIIYALISASGIYFAAMFIGSIIPMRRVRKRLNEIKSDYNY